MTLLEGKAYQMPMVSFNIKTGPKECIINNRNGYLIKAFDLKEMEKNEVPNPILIITKGYITEEQIKQN